MNVMLHKKKTFLNFGISAAIVCGHVKFSVDYHCLVHIQDMQLVLLYLT